MVYADSFFELNNRTSAWGVLTVLCNLIEIYDNRSVPWFLQDENYSFRNEF
jgi:hypothetical protein